MNLTNQLKEIENITIRLLAMFSQLAIDHYKNRFVADSIYKLARQEQRTIKNIDRMLTTLNADNEENHKAYSEAVYFLNVYKSIDRNQERI